VTAAGLRRSLLTLAGAVVAIAVIPATAGGAPRPTTLQLVTVPALPHVRVMLDGSTFQTNPVGIARIPHNGLSLAGRLRVKPSSVADGVRATLSRWNEELTRENLDRITARLDVRYRVQIAFVDRQRKPVDLSRVTSLTLRSSHGILHTYSTADLEKPIWLHGTRVVSRSGGPEAKDIYYTVDRAIVDGANVVNRAQQRFYPSQRRSVKVELLFFRARFSAHDALFRFPMGAAVRLQHPDGHWERYPFGPGAKLELTGLPRGDYWVEVEAAGMSFLRPVSLSRDQVVELEVLSYVDMGAAATLFLVITFGLLLIGRPHLLGYVTPALRLASRALQAGVRR
jgi:hypothetical protein